MHPFTSLTLWLWLSSSVIFLPLGWPLILVSCCTFIALVIWPASRYRWRFVAWFILPMAAGLWLIHSGWLAHWLTGVVPTGNDPQRALALWLRLLAIISGAQIWLAYVPTERFIRALLASRLPISLSYLLAGPLLLLAQLRQQLTSIREAQLARGVPLDGNIWQRLISLPALLLPLVTHTLSELSVRGAALDMRGFRSTARRTTLNSPTDTHAQSLLRYCLLVLILIEGGIRWWW